MQFSIRTMALMLIAIYSVAVYANERGWVSGGGELVRDQQNPWYLANTKKVTYCLEIDEVHFGLKKEIIANMLPRAFVFWKKQFFDKSITWGRHAGFSFILGTQDFIFQERCSSNTDIRFQFGVLNPEQFRYLENPRRMVGIAVRTNYDRVNLRGQGFIYISPQQGPLAMDLIGGQQLPWSAGDGALLYPVLLHEIGHIFGLKHDPSDILMKDSAPEMFVNIASDRSGSVLETFKNWYQNSFWEKLALFSFNSDLPFPFLWSCSMETSASSNTNSNKGSVLQTEVNGVSQKQSLFDRFFEIERPSGSSFCKKEFFRVGQYQMFIGPSEGAVELLGHADLKIKSFITGTNSTIAHLWLPEEQLALPPCRDQYCGNGVFEVGWAAKGALLKGTWNNHKTGTQRPIFIQAHSPFVATIGGVFDGQIYLDLNEEY